MFVPGLVVLGWAVSWAASQSIDPSTIPLPTRDQWCNQQKTSCPLICLQLPNGTSATESNSCDPATLDYSCVCSDGQSPNSTEYSQTIPYYICTAYNSQCQTNCNGNSNCQAACVQDHPCGAQEPKLYNITSTAGATATKTGTATSSGGGNVVYTGFGTGSATTETSSSEGSAAIVRPLLSEFGQIYGLFMVITGFVGGFAVLL